MKIRKPYITKMAFTLLLGSAMASSCVGSRQARTVSRVCLKIRTTPGSIVPILSVLMTHVLPVIADRMYTCGLRLWKT